MFQHRRYLATKREVNSMSTNSLDEYKYQSFAISVL